MADDNDTTLSLPVGDVEKYVVNFPPPVISISGGDGAWLVKIHPDGTLEYGPGYTPDEAARSFWDAMRIYLPTRCSACGHIGLLEGPQ